MWQVNIKLMQGTKKNFFREPIHMNIQFRGKLRKKQQNKVYSKDSNLMPESFLGDLVVFSTFSPTNEPLKFSIPKSGRRHRGISFFNNKFGLGIDHKSKNVGIQSERAHSYESGSFRAIHTANNYESNRGFPLRSTTPIRPYRRGIKISQALNLGDKIDLQAFYRSRKQPNYSKKVNNSATIQPKNIELNSQDNSQFRQNASLNPENGEQFYKYKSILIDSLPVRTLEFMDSEDRRIKGTQIVPFSKIRIRQINKTRGLFQHHEAIPIEKIDKTDQLSRKSSLLESKFKN